MRTTRTTFWGKGRRGGGRDQRYDAVRRRTRTARMCGLKGGGRKRIFEDVLCKKSCSTLLRDVPCTHDRRRVGPSWPRTPVARTSERTRRRTVPATERSGTHRGRDQFKPWGRRSQVKEEQRCDGAVFTGVTSTHAARFRSGSPCPAIVTRWTTDHCGWYQARPHAQYKQWLLFQHRRRRRRHPFLFLFLFFVLLVLVLLVLVLLVLLLPSEHRHLPH